MIHLPKCKAEAKAKVDAKAYLKVEAKIHQLATNFVDLNFSFKH